MHPILQGYLNQKSFVYSDTQEPSSLHICLFSTQTTIAKAAGTGPAGRAKTGPLFPALDWVMIIYCIHQVVKVDI